MLNLSGLFYSGTEEATFHQALDLSTAQREFIVEAKTVIRGHLREIVPQVLMADGQVAVQPRFFTQGSWAYKTLNSPAQSPQQADIDDGAYLPLSFVSQTGRPSIASAVFFRAAETALAPLVRKHGWKLICSKATCVRVEIAAFAHVDIPLYAIPDGEFTTLEKAARMRARLDARGAIVMGDIEEDTWTNLPSDSVLLAHRESDWLKSDPRPIKKWFLEEVDRHGEQFRRSVRYLKAFRDWRWATSGPSSILLMVAAAPLFEQRVRRDDLALLDLAEKLPASLRRGVCNPVCPSESLTDRLGEAGVADAARALEDFASKLRDAIGSADASQACSRLVDQFGARFPNEPSRVRESSVASVVFATPIAQVSSPLVGRTKAG
jgi:hypothetical protein